MSITFSCKCGKPLRAKEEMAGKKTKCPHCGAVLAVPTSAAKAAAAVVSGSEAGGAMHPDALPVEDLNWSGDTGSTAHAPTADYVAPGAGVLDVPVRPSDLPKPTDGTLQYKVLSQKDHSASGKLNFQRLEEVLNEHARQGWIVRSSFVVDMPGHAGHHDELVLILER